MESYFIFCFRCEPGFDGGLDQWFMLEVIDVMSGIMLANVSSHRPVFIITGERMINMQTNIVNQNVFRTQSGS